MDDFDLKLGICPVCGKRCTFKCFNAGYSDHCCADCAHKDDVVKEKTKQTYIKNFGVENPFQSKEIKEQIKETLLERYGGDHPMHCKDIVDKLQKTNIERYGNICSLHGEEVARKVEETNMERYGVKNGGGSKEAVEKIHKTTLERYGTIYYTQSQQYKDSYYDEYLPKYEQTCIDRFGARNFSSSQEYKNRQESIVDKIYQTKKDNNIFGRRKTKVEEGFEKYLIENNIDYIYQYKNDLYPFNCDFYIVKYDLYIEIQGFWTHGKHPYDENSLNDKLILDEWKIKSIVKPQYKSAINTWIVSDPLKRKTAKENNLNWIEIFSIDVQDVIDKFINIISK